MIPTTASLWAILGELFKDRPVVGIHAVDTGCRFRFAALPDPAATGMKFKFGVQALACSEAHAKAVTKQSNFNAKAQRCRGAKVETEIDFRKPKARFSDRIAEVIRSGNALRLGVFALKNLSAWIRLKRELQRAGQFG